VKESAIDVALENNQIIAVTIIIEHLTKYQNSYIYSYLFRKNLVRIIEKGIEISSLLMSNIFCYEFDFQDWPSIHENSEEMTLPFNDNIF